MASSPPRVPSSPSPSESEPPTPKGKIQAILAQFSDSDSGDAVTDARPANPNHHKTNPRPAPPTSDDDSDADVPVARKSRMAARLATGSKAATISPRADKQITDTSPRHVLGQQTRDNSSDELARPQPRRRLLTKRKRSPAASPKERPSEPASPLFFPSPTRSSAAEPEDDGVEILNGDEPQPSLANSRFKALVEKQRKRREEKEDAERAKRAAREQSALAQRSSSKRPRGSSPADDSHESSEGSDADAARKIAQGAKPSRKASKKAMEEMKRETQRMSRNMQLAHQAKVKKRISKDAFLARFKLRTASNAANERANLSSSRTASPEYGSDADRVSRHTTPPTSPLEAHDLVDKSAENALVEPDAVSGLGLVLEAPSMEEIGLDPQANTDKGKGKAAPLPAIPDEPIQVSTGMVPTSEAPAADVVAAKKDRKSRIAELLRASRASSTEDDGDDLEVVTSKGDMRKYAAFERLPKRKAKEMPSHLALRALAHVGDSERNDRASMTTAEMQASLRRAAREQARKERQEKIEELKAKGVIIQTAEERERDQQEVEDLVEKARQEAAQISKREKEAAKKDGTFVKDGLDDDDSDEEDDDFATDEEDAAQTDDEESDDEEIEERGIEDLENEEGKLFDDQADEDGSEEELEIDSAEHSDVEDVAGHPEDDRMKYLQTPAPRRSRNTRILSDDEDDDAPRVETPVLPQPSKTPQSLFRSARKQIPGLHMSDDMPLGLTQAFDATMAESQTQEDGQTQAPDSIDCVAELPSPGIAMLPQLNRLDSLDMVSESQPASQTQPLDISLSFSQSQRIPESPTMTRQAQAMQATPSQHVFEPTQDEGYVYSPFTGNRFASETPQADISSTVETVPLHEVEASPIVQRKGRLRRGRNLTGGPEEAEENLAYEPTAFEVMRRAARNVPEPFDKNTSKARDIIDEAAEESDDEYAGLGGASDDENANDAENDDDRRMIDLDTQVGKGDEAALAGYHADRERRKDEADVSKLLQDITTGRLRKRRGANDELDLSDEEDAVARKREAKRREFARMRRELLKDEAVGKIAEEKNKEAFLRTIEDPRALSDDDDFDEPDGIQDESQSQTEPEARSRQDSPAAFAGTKRKRPLELASETQLNRQPPALRRNNVDKKPATLIEIRENLSFLVEESESQVKTMDQDTSDSEEEPEKYVDLDRHAREAETDERVEDDGEGLGDFIVDDDDDEDDPSREEVVFKKPPLPTGSSNSGHSQSRSSLAHRRSQATVVNRLSMLRQSSSSSSTTKMAFSTSTSTTFKVPPLLRRATTNSSVSSLISNESTSATGVTVAKPERGHVSEDKVFIRKNNTGRRNAVNFQAGERPQKMSERAGVSKKTMSKSGKGKRTGGLLGDLLGRSDTWG
ncbi:uncharacterized protein HMPREF1541_03281 [Cyphellophora europaea CBS 101466]|uniref:DNA replication checkpoint mediator MRC1 domain-containing protein n=1 Tax=Cyphellophora europaea (strain CBS 101466) TaxID=1220924 RepID=W2RXW0_CYPE1|nr:uncharacterized protein HMPREF1541_03281 [Cyphellophora europaea CBS 101466]ETN41346.1 hypothetical protein HMPREF1541_03281 [Cyphellophora europaea CBS 101466]